MTTNQELLEYCAKLLILRRQLNNEIVPQTAHLLCETAHGEEIIEAAQALQDKISNALADVRITIK